MNSIENREIFSHMRLFEEYEEMHSALSESYEMSADTWRPLGDSIISSTVFQSWQRQRKDEHWTLRCVGGPGSGKTTLSAQVIEMLENKYKDDKEAVASIFLQADVVCGGSTFVEDILHSVFRQLCVKYSEADAKEDCVSKYRLYLDARRDGDSDGERRVRLVRDALLSRLGKLVRAFLIIDDLDRCSASDELLLENELSMMGIQGLKVFITSRIPCLKRASQSVECDSCPDKGVEIDVYWECESCKRRGLRPEEVHVLCQVCRDGQRACRNCRDSENFIATFDYIELNIDSNCRLPHFIDWDLEREHGNLGNNDKNLPPHSALGRWLTEARNHEELENLREKIRNQADMNVSLVRLRLDNIHRAESVNAVRASVTDVLPANIVKFFDASMQCFQTIPSPQRELGLQVIAAVTTFDYGHSFLDYEVVSGILEHAARTNGRDALYRTQPTPFAAMEAEDHVSRRKIKEMLHAARGFVVVEDREGYPMSAYCDTFHTYAKESYNEDLTRARANLNVGCVTFDSDGLGSLKKFEGQ
ncbi:Putative AAA+ ATPase domain, P-loop containing nucleoside triphosphate hydrolase [Colletotrichum destructivum]|uniref:AAA+ ATPase domain, P-loop containing nucleoside triphosphate hydrolase n=1 Tax=Colletotrichum destructivum TaxID=34406 RepID=A0AAX4ILH5_9PEZI|nr:Putative AAA+ ATPase domain, P-loop containing nucleoside triphosphate hydrolase [Colletotrichum destructivum]